MLLRSALVAGAITTLGCQTNPWDVAVDPRAGADGSVVEVPGSVASDSPVEAAVQVPSPTGDLALADALALAVVHHPGLRAYAMDRRAAEAAAIQARRWPNPELELEAENFAGTGRYAGLDAIETTLSLAQTIPLGGDLDRRGDVAAADTQLAEWDYQVARLEVLLDTTQRFIAAVAAGRRIELAERELALAESVRDLTRQRVEAGDAAPVEMARVVVPVVEAQVALQRARRERDAAHQRLAMTWGSRTVTFAGVSGPLETLASPPQPARLVERINRSPQVARWATQVSAYRARSRLAEAEAQPDLTGRLGLRYDNDESDVALVAGLSLPLPLWDTRQGEVLSARWGAASAVERQREAALRLESMLSEAWAELAGAYDEAIALQERALPAATQAYDATRRAFEQGQMPFLDVLDAQRTLFDLQARYVDTLIAYHAAVAEIESLIGQPLTDLDHDTPSQEHTP